MTHATHHDTTTTAGSVLLALLAIAGLASCSPNGDPPVDEQAFTRITHYIDDADGQQPLRDAYIEGLEQATSKLDVAHSTLEDDAIVATLIAAHERGVAVRVVTDDDQRGTDGAAALEAAGITISYGDGELKYLPEPTLTSLLEACFFASRYVECTQADGGRTPMEDAGLMIRPNDYNQMSNNFAVVDEQHVWSFAAPFGPQDTMWFGWSAHSQDLAIAFTREFQQMAGGVFATTLDVFNGPVKSTVHGIVYDSTLPAARPGRTRDLQPGYLTTQGIMRIEFNPQQRLVKELIDEIYRARASVYLITDSLSNEFVVDALNYKARAGFDVKVLVRDDTFLPEPLTAAGALRQVPDSYEYLPTVLIVDDAEDRNGDTWARTGMVMTHALMYIAPFDVFSPQDIGNVGEDDDTVRIFPSDLFADGTLWTLREFLGAERQSSPIDRMNTFFNDAWDANAP